MVESPEQCEEFCGNYNSNMAGMKRFKRSPGLPLDGPGRPDLDDQDYKNQENDKEKCNYFTYLSHRGRSSCYLLSGCSEQKPECTERSACVSGGIDCHVGKVCPKLVHKSGEHSRWRCEKVNPYTKDIPAGTFCHTWCPSWRNKKGELVTAQSVCQEDGSWSQSVAFPPGPLSTPATLPRPDDQDPPCGCEPLTLTYNPNEEKGTEFYCNTQLNWTTLPLPLLTDNVCHLLCDKMLIDVIECKNGVWSGRPEDGFWCNHPKPMIGLWGTNEDMIINSPKPQKTTTPPPSSPAWTGKK